MIAKHHTASILLFLALQPVLAVALAGQTAPVLPKVETAPVPHSGDAADDMTVWVHPTVPDQSLVIGADKEGGIAVYNLAGSQLQYLPHGDINNVDIRYGFPLSAGSGMALVTSGERSQDRIAIYAVDPNARQLLNVAAGTIALGFDVYGCCMYHSQVTGDYYFFGTSESGGHTEQWRLFVNGAGLVSAVRVRTFDVGSTCEGCVADDENGWFFVAEEGVGIWRYGAEPGAGTARVMVDTTGSGGHLTSDVEGLSIYYASGGAGYLLASSQGSDTFVVYDRQAPHTYRRTFQIVANSALGIDRVTGTDGIDVVNLGLGSAFPNGAFLAQDDTNPGANQNFKLVSWSDIANAASPPLLVNNSYDALGARARPATWAYRNGSGVNPPILTNVQPPVVGSTWAGDLNCTGHVADFAVLGWFSHPGSGIFLSPGVELLVDPSSPFQLLQVALHAGNVTHFSLTIPGNLLLCGVQLSVQGACFGAPALNLSNAIDLTLGR